MTKEHTKIDDHLHWYKDAIIYELHIKAFMDSNGDGIGDFTGLLNRLDYLEDLGVTAIWLLPFYPSPLRDDGYDIADYYNINPSYGKKKHLRRFIKAAHKRNLKVITELVINHTSDQHPWFQRARLAPKGSVERDYYVWSDDPKKYKGVRIIFQDYEASNWSWDPVAKQYYWHRFFHHQPDLNYDNPKVQEEVFKIIDYWFDMGIDGFRLDAVPYLFEREGTNCENLPETHDFLKKLRRHVDENYTGKLLLAEANMWPEDSAAYFGDEDECHMNYHFPIMPRMFMAMQMEDRYPITDIFDQTPEIPETCQWAIFLRNHDELTLEMVTDEERDYMYKVYAKNPKAKINLGIRHRLAPLMDNNRKKIELINYLLFSMPGTPVIYYGDEIGMGDNYYLGDRDGVRTPMQWSPDRNAGFSNANPQQLYLPVILDPEYHFGSVNVETQQGNSSSLLWWMKRVINMRKKFKAFSRGAIEFLHSENSKVLAFTRTYQEQIILVVVNLSRFSQAAELDLNKFDGYTPMEVFSKNEFPIVSEHQDYTFTLSPHAYHWFLLKKEPSKISGRQETPTVALQSWEEVDTPAFMEILEADIFPAYLQRSDWFMENGRKIHNTRIIDRLKMPVNGHEGYLIILEVNYESGLPNLYQLGLTFSERSELYRSGAPLPNGIIAQTMLDGVSGFIYDGLFDADLQKQLLFGVAANKKVRSAKGQIRFQGDPALAKYAKKTKEIRPRNLLSKYHNNISVLFNNDYYLKLYRKLDRSVNSDLEMTRYLSEKKSFEHIPSLAGSIELSLNKDAIVLGMAQKAVEHHTDAWNYLVDDLRRYYEEIQSCAGLEETTLKGSLADPLTYEDIPDEDMKMFIGPVTAERVRLLGKRVAKMHLALLGDDSDAEFSPEAFSLHYQRSLFSSFQSVVRKAYQTLGKRQKDLPEHLQEAVEQVLPIKRDVLTTLKQIYKNKIDIVKIRIHGDLHLGQVLFTGRDFVFVDFEGDPSLRYSERRLKRAALEDVAEMIRSFHHVAYEGLLNNNNLRKEEKEAMRPWAEKWYHYMSQIFMQAYVRRAESDLLVPASKEDLEKIMDVFLLERMMMELERELQAPYRRLVVPLSGILGIMGRYLG